MEASVVTSSDGGVTWNVQSVPPGTDNLYGVSCASPSDCMAVGVDATGNALMISTSDGGNTWKNDSAAPGTSGYGVTLEAASCPSASVCMAVGWDGNNDDGVILTTTDGGTIWVNDSQNQNSGLILSSISCPSTSDCTVAAYDGGFLTTSDGGSSWTFSTPSNPQSDYLLFDGVSCVTSTHCMAVSGTDFGGNTGAILSTYEPTPPTGSLAARGIAGGQTSINGKPCQSADPVNCASGDFWESYSDISAGGKGLGLSLNRTYNSLEAAAGIGDIFGVGWSSNVDRHLTFNADGSITYTDSDGSQATAVPTTVNGTTTYAFPAWVDSTLTTNGSTWTLVEHQRITHTFNELGHITSESDPNGNATTFTYCATGPCALGGNTYASDQLEFVTDPSGLHAITFSYDALGYVHSATDPLGLTTVYTYTSGTSPGAEDLVSVTDAAGRVTSFSYYPGSDLVETVTKPTGASVTNVYGSSVDVAASQLAINSYSGVVVSQTIESPSGHSGLTTKWMYTGDNFSSTGGTTTITDPDGNVRVEHYTDGSLTQITTGVSSPAAATTTFAVCLPTAPATTCSANNATYQAGQRESMTVQSGAGPETTEYTYDQYSNVLTITDPMGRMTTYAGYNAFDEPQSVTDPMGITTTYTYDSYGNLTSQTLSPDATACGTQSPCAGLTSNSDVCETATCTVGSNSYTRGEIESTTDPRGDTTAYVYDAMGNLVSTTDPMGNTTKYAYDADGRQYCTVAPVQVAAGDTCPTSEAVHNPGTTSRSFDGIGRIVSSTDPLGHTTTTSYDVLPSSASSPTDCVMNSTSDPMATYCTVVTDPMGNVTVTAFDPLGRTVGTTSGFGTPQATSTYDAFDLVPGSGTCPSTTSNSNVTYCTSSTDGSGLVTTHVMNALDQDVETISPGTNGGTVSSFTYDGAGNVATKSTAAGTTAYTYDLDNEVLGITYGAPSSGYLDTPNVSYAYDADGNRKSMTDGTGTTSYSYDGFERLQSTTNGAGALVGYSYDQDSDKTGIQYGSAGTVTRSFNADDQLSQVTDWYGNTTNFTYDANGNLQQENLPNGDSTVTSYNDANQTTGISYAPTASLQSPFASISYVPNSDGQVSSASTTGSLPGPTSQTYSYNSLTQLTADSAVGSYGYDLAGNLTSLPGNEVQAYDAAGQLCYQATGTGTCTSPPAGATTYQYNGIGARSSSQSSSSVPATTYSYNEAGQLSSVGSATNQFVPVTPTRICDTRGTSTQCPDQLVQAGTPLTIAAAGSPIPRTTLDIPSSAYAVVLNVTATGNSAATYFTVYPGGTPIPSPGSQLNEPAPNTTVNNEVTVALGTGAAAGTVNIANASGTTNLIVDIVGYYAAPSNGSGFSPMPGGSVRLCDTRTGNSLTGGAAQCTGKTLGSGSNPETLTVNVTGVTNTSGQVISAPQGATAVVADLTAIDPSTSTFLTAYDGDGTQPGTSSLNVPIGGVVNKEVTVQLGASGTIKIANNAGTVDVTVDIEGYFVGGAGDTYVPVTSTRICDTRAGNPSNLSGSAAQCNGKTMASNATLTISTAQTFGSTTIPSTARALVLDVVAVNEQQSGYLTVYPIGYSQPNTSSLNYEASTVTNNGVTTRTSWWGGDLNITNTSAGSTDVIVDVEGYYLPPTSAYSYNGDGLRMAKNSGSTVDLPTTYAWDTATSSGVPQMLEQTWVGTNDYVYGPNGILIETIQPNSNQPLYYLNDALGSVRMLAIGSGAAGVQASYSYSPYGDQLASSGAVPNGYTNPFGFAGAYTDQETGFLYLINRYYDPATGQFLTIDPLVQTTGQPYAYAGNDPVNGSDPSGLCLNSKGINVGGACSAAQLAVMNQQLVQAEAQSAAADAAAAACTNAFTCAINDPSAVAASFNANRSTIITNVAVVAAVGAVVLTAGAATPFVAEAAGTAFVAGDVAGDFVAVSAMANGAAGLSAAGDAFGYVSLVYGVTGTANACIPQLGGSFGATCALNAAATVIGYGGTRVGGLGGALIALFSSAAGYFNIDQAQCQG